MKEKLPDWLENARLKNAGQQLPADYFDGLAERVFQKWEAEKFNLETMDELPGFLRKLKQEDAGFALPDGYFEKLPGDVFEKMADRQADYSANLIGEFKTANTGFNLPENYFETLPDRVFEKLDAPERMADWTGKQSKTIEIRSKWTVLRSVKWSIAAAAAVGLVAVSMLFFGEKFGSPACETSQCLAQNLSDEEVHAWILENLNEFEAVQLADDESVADLETSLPTKRQEQIDLETEEIESELNRMLDELSDEDLENVL